MIISCRIMKAPVKTKISCYHRSHPPAFAHCDVDNEGCPWFEMLYIQRISDCVGDATLYHLLSIPVSMRQKCYIISMSVLNR